MIVSNITLQAEGLGDYSKSLGKKGFDIPKKMAKIVLKDPGRALKIGANVGSAFASRILKNFIHPARNFQFPSHRKKALPSEICIIYVI